MKIFLQNLLKKRKKNKNKLYIFTGNKLKMGKPLQPVPFYWALIPLDVETAINKNKSNNSR